MRPLSLLAALLPAAALAVFPEEAYTVDYHHALLGAPQRHSSFFHRPQAASKASLLYTLTDKLQVGAVLPKDGSVVWRHQLPAANASFLVIGDGVNSVVSGVDREVAAWRAVDGRLVWKRAEDLPGDLVHLNTLDLDDGRKDVLGLFEGETPVVQRIDGRTGSPVWQYTDNRYDRSKMFGF
jgi:outer membrane protein assembly factor BamB